MKRLSVHLDSHLTVNSVLNKLHDALLVLLMAGLFVAAVCVAAVLAGAG